MMYVEARQFTPQVMFKVRTTLVVILILFVSGSVETQEIIIDETGFDNIRIGKASIEMIKKRNPLCENKKTFKHLLHRTREGRVGEIRHYEEVRCRDGITYFFVYENETQDTILLDRILFSLPANVRTDKGIKLGESNFQEVEQKYGAVETTYSDKRAMKAYDGILFYSERLTARDSIDSSFVVTGILITGDD